MRSTRPEDKIEDWYIIMGAFCLQWFSLFDILDGMRARRLKCGSPLGRLVDEGKKEFAKFKLLALD